GWEWGFTEFGSPGPGLFPALAAALMGAAALAAAWRRAPRPEPMRQRRLLAYIAAALGFPLLLEPAGTTLAIAAMFLLLLRGLERLPWRVVVPVTAGATAGSFLLFDRLLRVPLPHGWWLG
ncbi:tripartite tricarboxylate transporter TctB family protein, partial [Falsiroseomonas oryzae]|uniref:tripartite tricarboxylate transporter TctB family protein n=1 Tax=Falsiroseomonas oryzae TaxID=2766473 RepID=UPI0022EB2541